MVFENEYILPLPMQLSLKAVSYILKLPSKYIFVWKVIYLA